MSDLNPTLKQLNPCPFCGYEGRVVERYPAYKPWSITCECGCTMGWFYTKEKAIEAWNRRAGDAY